MNTNFGRLEQMRQTSRSADTLQRVVFQTAVLLEINLRKPMALSYIKHTTAQHCMQVREKDYSCASKHDMIKNKPGRRLQSGMMLDFDAPCGEYGDALRVVRIRREGGR